MNRVHLMIGCTSLALGLLLGGIFVGRATAQGPGFRRYEYMCQPNIEKPWKPDGAMKLNTLGAQGWELIQQLPSNTDVFCFKRGPF
jgi:uncharacterized membrane protein